MKRKTRSRPVPIELVATLWLIAIVAFAFFMAAQTGEPCCV